MRRITLKRIAVAAAIISLVLIQAYLETTLGFTPNHYTTPMNYPETIPASFASDSTLERSYRMGWNHGHGFACHNLPSIGDTIDRSMDWIGLGKIVTADNIAEYHELLCFAAETNSRDFSPFEFIAHEFNESEDSESLWEAFESGIADSIRHDLEFYSYVELV
jgi:hypothetical protein